MIRAVLFDLDGTLLDTAPDLVGALNQVRAAESLPPVEVTAFRQHVSKGAAGLILAGLPAGDDALFEQRKSRLLAYYREHLYDQSEEFPGIRELLRALGERGIPWGIVTNKPESLTLPLLSLAGLTARAACVVCGDTVAHSKPHPAPVLLACEVLGVSPAEALMVGDDLRDLEAGQAAGTQVAFADYGYTSVSATLSTSKSSHHRIGHPSDILELLGGDDQADFRAERESPVH